MRCIRIPAEWGEVTLVPLAPGFEPLVVWPRCSYHAKTIVPLPGGWVVKFVHCGPAAPMPAALGAAPPSRWWGAR